MESVAMNSERKTDADLPRVKKPHNGPGPEPRRGGSRTRNLGIVVITALLAAGAIAAWLLLRKSQSSQAGRPVPAPESAGSAVPAPSGQPETAAQQQPGELMITLSRDKLDAAQIKTEPATEQPANSGPGPSLRTTGTVASNQYKETPVFPIAGGIVRQVNAQLGDRVRRGQPLLTLSSTELANAQAEYLKMTAEYEEHEKAHHRTAQLVEIGAASREDLEQHTARVESMRASLAGQRQQLIQLGMTAKQVEALRSPDQVNSLVSAASPVSGTVISRTVNSGEVVATGKELFRVADLSSVWVLGQVYEKDLGSVREGTPAIITTPAYQGRTFNGRVSYIDPRIDPQTRTAQVRIEVPNPGQPLKIGMYVDIALGENPAATLARQNAVVVPAGAIQMIGNTQVVYVATDQAGVFVQRQVNAGPESSGLVPVYSGVSPGERVVTDGSFLLRAESLKQKADQLDSSTRNLR
jgi:membrane fusion protein, heavy metal efflux system